MIVTHLQNLNQFARTVDFEDSLRCIAFSGSCANVRYNITDACVILVLVLLPKFSAFLKFVFNSLILID